MIDYESCHVIKIFQKNFEFQKLAFFSNKVTPLPQLKGYTALLTLKGFQMMKRFWNRSLIGWFIESDDLIGQERHLASINMKTSLISGISKVKHYLCICTTIDRVVASDHGGFYMSKFVSILVSKNRININLNALVNISSNIFALPFQEKKYIFVILNTWLGSHDDTVIR